MDLRSFQDLQTAVAEQRAVIDLDHLTARRLVVRGQPPLTEYIGAGSRWVFRLLGLCYLGGLASGLALLVSGRFLYAAIAFLAAIVVQQLWGGLAVDLVRTIALRDAAFCQLALREGWITLIEPPVAPGRTPRPVALGVAEVSPYEEEVARTKAALASRPDDAQARFDLGLTYLLMGKFDLALEESRVLTMTDARLAAKLQALTRLLAS
jgi:tetratricopeptide (TPR) repeat protein